MRALSLSKDERKIIYRKLNYVDWVMIRIAYNPKFEIDRNQLLMKCAKYGYLDIIKWVNPNGEELYMFFEKAIKHGKIEILKWFNYVFFNDYNICLIVKYNQLDILEYLWTPHEYNEYIVQRYASEFGNIKVLQWSLITKKHRFNGPSLVRRMIYLKHVEMLRWIVEYDPYFAPMIL
jgi:hypothetical protein